MAESFKFNLRYNEWFLNSFVIGDYLEATIVKRYSKYKAELNIGEKTIVADFKNELPLENKILLEIISLTKSNVELRFVSKKDCLDKFSQIYDYTIFNYHTYATQQAIFSLVLLENPFSLWKLNILFAKKTGLYQSPKLPFENVKKILLDPQELSCVFWQIFEKNLLAFDYYNYAKFISIFFEIEFSSSETKIPVEIVQELDAALKLIFSQSANICLTIPLFYQKKIRNLNCFFNQKSALFSFDFWEFGYCEILLKEDNGEFSLYLNVENFDSLDKLTAKKEKIILFLENEGINLIFFKIVSTQETRTQLKRIDQFALSYRSFDLKI